MPHYLCINYLVFSHFWIESNLICIMNIQSIYFISQKRAGSVQPPLVSIQPDAYVLYWLEINWLCTCRPLPSDPCPPLLGLPLRRVKRAVVVLVFPSARTAALIRCLPEWSHAPAIVEGLIEGAWSDSPIPALQRGSDTREMCELAVHMTASLGQKKKKKNSCSFVVGRQWWQMGCEDMQWFVGRDGKGGKLHHPCFRCLYLLL